MSETEYCVKNMRLKTVMEIFSTKEEAAKESRRLNTRYQTNEYWVVAWKETDRDD